MGALVSDPAARAVRVPSGAAHAGVGDRPTGSFPISHQAGGACSRAKQTRRRVTSGYASDRPPISIFISIASCSMGSIPPPRASQVVLTLKTPYRDGTTHIVMSPLEFMQRLAALIPRPRLHLIRFHGVLAPNARLRPEIIPTVPVNAHTPSADPAEAPPAAAPARLSWARLLKRVFDIDLEHCPRCGGPLKIIAAPSTGSGQASNVPPSLRRSSPTSACSPGHRPDPWPGPSTDSNWPELPRIPTPSGSAPEPTASLGLRPPETRKRSET